MTSTCTKDLDKNIFINRGSKYIKIDLSLKILFDFYYLISYIMRNIRIFSWYIEYHLLLIWYT